MSAIKSCGILMSFCCVLTSTYASSDVFDGVLGNTASCHKTCQMTYSLHTYPREEALYACQRGCRLFSICQFVGDSKDLNETKAECESACREAYTQSEEQYACNLGCQSQQPFAEQRMEQLLTMMPRIHLLYPLTLVRGFWEDMMSQAHSFITSSWTFYLQADDGKVVIFQSEPQVQFFSQFEFQRDETEESQSTFKHGVGSIMVWGCMSAAGTGELRFIEGNMESNLSCDFLKQKMMPSLQKLSRTAVFQHNNDPKHTAKMTTALLMKLKLKVKVMEIEWPSMSPELNPIEHLWGIHHVSNIQQFRDVSMEEWKRIPATTCAALVNSMPRRIKGVLVVDPEMKNPIYKDYPRSYIQERDRDMFIDRSNSEDDYNLFSCFSRNPWLPGWILTTTLVLSVLVLIWICCATVSTAVEQYVPAEKLSIYGDMENMKDQKLTPYLQSSLVIIRSPGVEEQEAGPLPSKVNLDQSNI